MEFIIGCFATAFFVGLLDAFEIPLYERLRPVVGLLIAALLVAPAGAQPQEVALVAGTAFVGLALPALLTRALTRVVTLTRGPQRL